MAFEEGLFDGRAGRLGGDGLAMPASSADDMSGCVAAGWFAVVVLVSAAAAGLSLPYLDQSHSDPSTVGEVVRFDWLILATFLVYPIRRCCEARIWLGLLATAAACAQSFYVVDTATERVAEYAVAAPAMAVWWAVPMLQLVCFTAFAVAGSRSRLAERRWQRLTAKLMRNPATVRPVRR